MFPKFLDNNYFPKKKFPNLIKFFCQNLRQIFDFLKKKTIFKNLP